MRQRDLFKSLTFAAVAGALVACGGKVDQQVDDTLAERLQSKVEELQSENPEIRGFSISIRLANGAAYDAAIGLANPDGALFTPQTRVRIASTTKTFVAATVLRLWEDGRLDLDAPISSLVDPVIIEKIAADGYDVEAITPRHLISHTSGMAEHTTENYLNAIMETPDREWTRMAQVDQLVADTEPVGAPLGQFSYSDTGYILLGDIIERIAGEPLPAVVREEMKFEEIGLGGVWWDALESTPERESARAHQYLNGADTYGWHGTLDAFGGGGVIASTEEMALFFAALFEGEIFKNPETLDVMIAAPGNPFTDTMRYGLFYRSVDGVDVFDHGGFWGTLAYYAPSLEVAIAGASLDQAGYPAMRAAMDEMLVELKNVEE